METNSSNNKAITLLSIICILSNFSYYPRLVASGLGRHIAIIIWILFGVYLLICRLPLGTSNTYKTFMILYAFFIVNSIIVGYINNVNSLQNHFFQPVSIATIIFLMANMLGSDVKKEDIRKVCIIYYYSMAALSIPLFAFYLRGTDLSSSVYAYQYGKNEISVLLLCALVIACVVYKPKTLVKQTIKICAIAFFLVDITLLRARSVLFGVGLLISVIIFNKHNISKKLRSICIFSVIIISCYFYLHSDAYYSFLNRIIFAGRDASNINELSSGRSDKILSGISTFLENPLFGVGERETLDCFYISILANYGLLGIPVIIMALIPLIWSIKNLRNHDDMSICFFTITSCIFIISFLDSNSLLKIGAKVRIKCHLSKYFSTKITTK